MLISGAAIIVVQLHTVLTIDGFLDYRFGGNLPIMIISETFVINRMSTT